MIISEVFNECCMVGMSKYPDQYFDLALCDPPYGIDKHLRGSRPFSQQYKEKGWDTAPGDDYFKELFRVSKNQIIWGGNYFNLGRTRGFIVWDKKNDGLDFSECEFAWTSYDKVARIFRYRFIGRKLTSHPTEKPVKLYKWLLENYASKGFKIIDTHMGSQSSRIAAFQLGFNYYGWEIDKDYFIQGNKVFKEQTAQIRMF
jgi:site-specific DNA-methyltransferase (adenine-specific)